MEKEKIITIIEEAKTHIKKTIKEPLSVDNVVFLLSLIQKQVERFDEKQVYLGPNLPKEPRKFEFEVYISSNILEDKLDSLKYIHLTQEGLNNPIKFKLTMKEILE